MLPGSRFGVISILEASIPRHRRYIEALGLGPSLAGDRPIGLGVTALGDDPEATGHDCGRSLACP